MTFSLKINKAKILKGIIETLASIIDETEFIVSPEEFSIVAMDPSRICLLKLNIKKEEFDEYKCDKESRVAVNLSDLDKILKRSDAKDSLSITFKDVEVKIKIQVQREGSARKRTFSLMLLDIDAEDVPMESLLSIDYPSSWTMEPRLFIEAIKDAEIYSEILQITSKENEGLEFVSSGQIGEMEYQMGIDVLSDFSSTGKNYGAYSITFLKNIMKLNSITEDLKISLKTDHPIKMIFELFDGGVLSYFLAPRVEESDLDDEDEF